MRKFLQKLSFKSIRTKLMVSLIAICMIPVAGLGIFSYSRSTKVIEHQFETNNIQTATEINRGIENYINAMSNGINTLTANYNITDIGVGENVKFAQGLLMDTKNSSEQITEVYYGTEELGKVILSGEIIDIKDFDYKQRPWYKDAVAKKGNLVVTDPYKSKDGGFVVTIAKTVMKGQKVVGVVGMDISLKELSDQFASIKIGKTGYVYLVDNNGILIAHPDEKVLGTDTITKLSYWNEAKSKADGFAEYEYQGVGKFVVFDTNKLTNWKVMSSIDKIELTNLSKENLYMTIVFMGVVLIVSILLAYLLSMGIVKNIKKLQEAFSKASVGDLTTNVEITSKDEFKELGKDFNTMVTNVSSLMRSVQQSSNTVFETSSNLASMSEETTASVQQVSVAIEEIAQGATTLAENSQESASEMGELAEQLNDISGATKEVERISEDTKDLSSEGLNVVNELIQKATETKETSMEVANIVSDMEVSTREINSISDSISQITEQTNLLSLNASIEAARAGEAGRGFAVVAGEIRKLADQSKASTVEIKKIINTIQSKTSTAVQAMKKTEIKVSEQQIAIEQTEKIFNEILSSIEILTNKVSEINSSVVGIQSKKDIVVQQIENTSAVSEETASSTEEVTASAEEITATMEEFSSYAGQLQELADKLQTEIGKFKLS